MKLDHWQGRDPAKQSADEDTFAEYVIRALIVICFAAILAYFGGCAMPIRVYTQAGVTFHENDLSPCLPHTTGCTLIRADGYHVYYSELDPLALPHEMDHTRGMRHSEWDSRGSESCATITAAGKTKWKVGTRICRGEHGFYARAI